MLVGFIHGVMNTDNMTISGETIDYGPCAFMDAYDPRTVFSSIDQAGRYAYGNQPTVALWNLARFAETLLPLMVEHEHEQEKSRLEATAVLDTFVPTFQHHWYQGALTKLGLSERRKPGVVTTAERSLIDDWHDILAKNAVDYTLAWRHLAESAEGDESPLRSLFTAANDLDAWLNRWREMQNDVAGSALASAMRLVNPIYIPRNHLVEEAVAAASDDGEIEPFERLLQVVRAPFNEEPQHARYAKPAAKEFTRNFKTFCGT